MSSQRVQYGYCSFVSPEGFTIQKEASFGGSDSANGAKLLDGRKSPLCITLTSTAVHPEVPDFSESPEDMNPDAYTVTLTLNTFVAHFAASALHYLRNAGEELKKHFTDFQTDFCQEDTVGEFSAAVCLAGKFHAGHGHNDRDRIRSGKRLDRLATFCRISEISRVVPKEFQKPG
jgi:hypothetical protein